MAREIRNLTANDVEAVRRIINDWPRGSRLTWNSLIEAIEKELYRTWSRQALDRHESIKQTYVQKRKYLQKATPAEHSEEGVPAHVKVLHDRIRRLESEVERLEMENHNLVEKFRRWSVNAHSKGLTEEILELPIPEVYEESTRDDR